MEELGGAPATAGMMMGGEKDDAQGEIVSTHVLVDEGQVARLRELSRRTRIAQSEYLREAVDDLLGKYSAPPEER